MKVDAKKISRARGAYALRMAFDNPPTPRRRRGAALTEEFVWPHRVPLLAMIK